MWPCEAIDPFSPPRGFKLLPEHKLALTPAERRLFLPDKSGAAGTSAAAAAAGGGGGVAVAEATAAAGEAGSPSESAAAGGSSAAAAAGEGGTGRRKLLLVWFHSNQYEWRWGDELQPFRQHKAKYKRE
jgi:hypothetical protein